MKRSSGVSSMTRSDFFRELQSRKAADDDVVAFLVVVVVLLLLHLVQMHVATAILKVEQ